MMILFKQILESPLIFLVFQFFFGRMSYGQSPNSEMFDVGKIFHTLAENFKSKIDEQFALIVQFDMKDQKESWHIIVEKGRKVTVNKGPHQEARFFFSATTDTLHLIYDGKMTAMTAVGKAKGSDHAPLDLRLAEGLKPTLEVMTQLYTFIQHFFNPSVPEKILLGEEYSRVVHGGHVIPLYYYPGFRSAWYLLKRGEKLNEPGDINPYPQAFIFIEGEGFAKMGNKTVKVRAGESYYIPPNSDHVVWTESGKPLILIWLAWGEGA